MMAVTHEQENYLHLLESLRTGDLDGVRLALSDPADWADARETYTNNNVMSLALIESPVAFVRQLLDLGADANYDDLGGYPSLLTVLSGDRPEEYELLELLLAQGADIQRRGINGYTPLHMAASKNDDRAIEMLLAHGADPTARTRVDYEETPLELAERGRYAKAVAALRSVGARE
jgi:ankyrin repeat protein